MIKTHTYLILSENVNKFWRLPFLVTSHAVWLCALDGNGSTLPTDLLHTFSYIIAIFIYNDFKSPNIGGRSPNFQI
jgi:hypothetical protein